MSKFRTGISITFNFLKEITQNTISIFSRHFFLISILIFSLGFHFDFLIESPKVIHSGGGVGEYLVFGRLAQSVQKGLLSHAGLPGVCGRRLDIEDNYRIFVDNKACKYNIYRSETGAQSALYYAIYLLYPFDNYSFVRFIKILVGVTLAFIIALFLNFIKKQLGIFTASASTVLILNLDWLVLYGDNLDLSFWAMAMIPLLIWHAIIRNKSLVLYSFIALALKCFTSGGNFVFSCLAMTVLPLVYRAVDRRWSTQKIRKKFIEISFGAVLGCLVVFIVLVFQLSVEFGFSGAKQHLSHKIEARTYAAVSSEHWQRERFINAQTLQLIDRYRNITVIWLNKHNLTFQDMTILLLISSVVSSLIKIRISPLIATAWVSLLVPLAWIVIAKGHAERHLHFVPVIINFPFAILVMVVFANSIEILCVYVYKLIRGIETKC